MSLKTHQIRDMKQSPLIKLQQLTDNVLVSLNRQAAAANERLRARKDAKATKRAATLEPGKAPAGSTKVPGFSPASVVGFAVVDLYTDLKRWTPWA